MGRRAPTTVTRAMLAERVSQAESIGNRRLCHRLVNHILQGVAEGLRAGDRVELRGFGVFTVRRWMRRSGRDARTGKRIAIPARNVVRFKASPCVLRP